MGTPGYNNRPVAEEKIRRVGGKLAQDLRFKWFPDENLKTTVYIEIEARDQQKKPVKDSVVLYYEQEDHHRWFVVLGEDPPRGTPAKTDR